MAFIAPCDASWTEALARLRHDFYHLPGYVALSARWEGGRPTAFLYESGGSLALVPLIVHGLDDGLCDAVSPYGYPSPLFSEGSGVGFQREALEAFAAEGRDLGLVSSFVRLHPLLQPSLPASEAGAWSVFEHGPTIALPLAEAQEDWLRRVSRNHRRNVRDLRRAGYTVRIGEPERLEDYARVYAETMERLDAAEHYRFPPSHFRELAEVLGERLLFVAVHAPEGETAAAGLFTCTGAIAQAHLSGTATAHLAAAPSKLMFVGARAEVRRRGASVLHLGGGHHSRRDTLFEFKRGFAGEEYMFASARFVHQPAVYERLARQRLRLEPAQPLPQAEFFPLYRQPSTGGRR